MTRITVVDEDADLVFNPEEEPSSNITNVILTGIQVRAITTDLSSRIGNVLRGRVTGGVRPTATGFLFEDPVGRSAGEGVTGFGVWSSYSYSDFKDDFVSTAFSGDSHSVLAGVDISPWDSTVFGVALGYENHSIKTRFNRGHMDSDGFTVAPYLGYLFTDYASVDAAIGYSRIKVDQFRTDPGTGDKVTSKPSSDRWFGMINGNLFKMYGNWIVGAHTGLLWAKNDQEGFRESDGTRVASQTNDLVQWNVGGDVGYSWGNFEPFVRAAYELDFSRTTFAVTTGPQPSNDDDNFLIGAGVRYFNEHGISGNLEWNKRLGRKNFSEDIFMFTLRAEF